MKRLVLFVGIMISVAAKAQVTKVSLQASGLTCSMCSNAINKSIKTLEFVDKVESNIKTSTFEISFKSQSNVDFDKLKKKVEDAGFAVANFTVVIQFNNIRVKSNEAVTVGDKTLRFVNVKEQTLNGSKAVRIIDKGFVSSKEFKKNSIASAASKSGKIYHVTI